MQTTGRDAAGRRWTANRSTLVWAVTSVLVLALLVPFSRGHFLLFHTVVEMAGIGVAWGVFMLLWNARRFVDEEAYIVLGLALLGAGTLDLLHTVTFKGMIPLVPTRPTDTPTQFWIAARSVETLGLVALPLLLRRRGLTLPAAVTTLVLTGGAILTIVVWDAFPHCFHEGQGLTTFKVTSEYVMVAIMALTMLLLYRRRELIDPAVHRSLQVALLASIGAELTFTLYTDVFGITIAVGHYFRLAARLAIYMALIHLSIIKPHALLFRHHQQQQERLEASEKRWRTLSAFSPDQTIDLDCDLKIRFANYPQPGLSMSEFLDQPILDFVPQQQRGWVASLLYQCLDSGDHQSYELSSVDADGLVSHFETTVVPQAGEGGVEGLTLVIRDITERRRQEQLRAARIRIGEFALSHTTQQLLQYVLDEAEQLTGSRIGFFHFVDADQSALHLQTWSTRTLTEMCSAEGAGLHYPVDQAGVWADCIRQRQPVVHNDYAALEYRQGMPEGHAEVVREAVVPVLRDGRVVAVIGVGNKRTTYHESDVSLLLDLADLAWDIVERKRTETALDESQRRLVRTMANLPGMVYRCANDEYWTMEFISESSLELTGYGAEELVENAVVAYSELIDPDDRVLVDEAVQQSLPERGFFQITYRLRHRDGRTVWVWEQGRGVFEDDRLVALEGFIYDITPQVRAQEERQAMERHVLQAQKLESLGVLAGGIAHDFNNLLQAMIGYAQLAELEVDPASEAAGNLHSLRSVAERAAELTGQMLAYSGRGSFTTEVLDLGARVTEMGNLLRSSVARTVDLSVTRPSEPLPVQADPAQIQQVVLNLVINAAEASGEGPGTVRVTTGRKTCSAEDFAGNVPSMYPDGDGPAPGDYAFLEVTDDGGGIAPDVLARIFEPFFTTKFTGRGLGLAAVLGILRGHRGALIIHTEPGRGSTFRVYLPLSTEPVARAASRRAPAADALGELPGRTVLVVEDEIPVRRYVTALLRRQGAEVLEAADGQEALRVFGQQADRIDCVLLDMTMPRLSGEQCLAGLRALRPDVVVIVMSGYSPEEIRRQFGDEPVAGFLSKPFSAGELGAALRDVLPAPL